VLPQKLLGAIDECRQHDEEVGGDERGDEDVLGHAHHTPRRDRGEAGDEAGKDPEREKERHHPVGEQEDPEAGELDRVDGADRVRGDGEEAQGHQPPDELVRAGEGTLGDQERIDQLLLALDSHERDAEDGAEEDDGGHDVVGEGVERIGGNVERDEVEGGRLLDEGAAEEGRGLHRREGERHEEHRGEGDRPQHDEEGADAQEEPLGARGIEASDPRDEGDGHVRQHRHLQEADEGVRREAQRLRPLAEEEPRGDAEAEADQDLAGEGHRAP
jgi:hypothetical protein